MKPHNYALVVFPLLIILSNLVFVLFYFPFYESEFEKLGVYDQLGKEQVDRETKNILNYFIGSEETLHNSSLSANERIHMLQVRDILRKILFLWLSLIVLFIVTLFLHPNFRLVFLWGSFAALVLIGLLVLFAMSFSSSFIALHEIVFQDLSWQLVAGQDVLLTMFPQQFFEDFLLRVIIQSILVSGIIIGLVFVLQRFKRSSAILSK